MDVLLVTKYQVSQVHGPQHTLALAPSHYHCLTQCCRQVATRGLVPAITDTGTSFTMFLYAYKDNEGEIIRLCIKRFLKMIRLYVIQW